MAEINAAYEELRHGSTAAGRVRWTEEREGDDRAAAPRRGAGPPRERPTRPVTGRLDTTETVRPRNATTSRPGARPVGQPPLRGRPAEREPLRASDPTGPLERARIRNFRRPEDPPLDVALGRQIDFGKFHGHTLGEIAAFEPSYIDWLANTITRDPELVAAARSIQTDLDRRGVRRIRHAERTARATPGQQAG